MKSRNNIILVKRKDTMKKKSNNHYS